MADVAHPGPETAFAPSSGDEAAWSARRSPLVAFDRRVGFCLLLILAAVVRWWHLWDIPSPTDELLGVGRGLSVARGESLPLTDFEPYIGSFWNYVLALGFLVAGPSEYVGRFIPFVAGILTVVATFLLAREMGGWLVGWIAAVLLATSSAHVLATSHPAWSHCFSPLFAALGLWQLQRSVRQNNARGLLLCALWLGLALQTHPTMAALLPGVALYLLLKRRDWLMTRWPYLAAGIGVLLVANIIVFNLVSDFGSVRRAAAVGAAYARGRGAGIELYEGNLARMGLLSLQIVSGSIDIRERAQDYLFDPLVLVPSLVGLGGALLLLRRGNPLPFLIVLPFAAALAVLNAKYEVIPNARFMTPLLPLVFAGSGALLVAGWQRLSTRPAVGPTWATVGLVAAVGGLATISLLGLARRYDQMAGSAQTTALIRAAVDGLEAARPRGEPVLLDRNLDRLWLDGGGELYMAISFELTRRGTPVGDLPGRVTPPTGETDPCVPQRLIVARVDLSRGAPRWLASGLRPNQDGVPTRFWTFRIVPASAPLGSLRSDEWMAMEYTPPLNGSARTVDRCAPGRLI